MYSFRTYPHCVRSSAIDSYESNRALIQPPCPLPFFLMTRIDSWTAGMTRSQRGPDVMCARPSPPLIDMAQTYLALPATIPCPHGAAGWHPSPANGGTCSEPYLARPHGPTPERRWGEICKTNPSGQLSPGGGN